jgi:hypothetical protein
MSSKDMVLQTIEFLLFKKTIKMKKYSYCAIAAIAVILFSLQSCTKEKYDSPENNKIIVKDISFNNGRIVFANHEQMEATINELYSTDNSSFRKWETSKRFTSYSTYRQNIINENYNNYLSMGENAPVKEYNKYVMPDLGLVANQNMEYQVGDSIFFYYDNKIYGLPYNGEESFNEIKPQIINNSFKPNEQNFSVFEIKIDTLKPQAVSLKSTEILDAHYQKQFSTNGHTYKFVFESFGVHEGSGVTVYVQSKLEYWHKRTWPLKDFWDQAGETIYKSVTNLRIMDVYGVSHISDINGNYGKTWGDFINYNLQIKSPMGYFLGGTYVKISGTIWSYTSCFENNSDYSVTSNCLWEDTLY